MTWEIALVLAVVVVAVVLFASEKLRVDMVALIVMAILLVTGIVTPEEGIGGSPTWRPSPLAPCSC